MRLSKSKQADIFDCFDDFNPNDDKYKSVVDNWTLAILDFMKMTYNKKNEIMDIQRKRKQRRARQKTNR